MNRGREGERERGREGERERGREGERERGREGERDWRGHRKGRETQSKGWTKGRRDEIGKEREWEKLREGRDAEREKTFTCCTINFRRVIFDVFRPGRRSSNVSSCMRSRLLSSSCYVLQERS